MSASIRQIFGWFDVSKILVLINVLVLLCMLLNSGWSTCFTPSADVLMRWGANVGALTVSGQYWRLVTSIFVHAGILHLGLNMYALWTFGPSVSEIFGNKKFLLIYFLSGLGGSLASTVWDPAQTSAGASGALVGIAGAMLSHMLRGESERKEKRFVQPLFFFAVICASLLYGFFIPGIDNAAHVGGLFAGFLCGFALAPSEVSPSGKNLFLKTTAFVLVVAAIFASCLLEAKADKRSTTYQIVQRSFGDLLAKKYKDAYAGYDGLLKSELNANYFVGRANALIGMKQYDRAIADCNKAMAISPKNRFAYLSRARAFHEEGNDIEAVEDLSVILKTKPQHSSDLNMRAWFETSLGDFNKALDDVNQALKLDPSSYDALDTRGVIYFCLKQPDRALPDLERAIALKPEEGASYYHRSLIYQKGGKSEQAKQDLEKANQLKYVPEHWEGQVSALSPSSGASSRTSKRSGNNSDNNNNNNNNNGTSNTTQ